MSKNSRTVQLEAARGEWVTCESDNWNSCIICCCLLSANDKLLLSSPSLRLRGLRQSPRRRRKGHEVMDTQVTHHWLCSFNTPYLESGRQGWNSRTVTTSHPQFKLSTHPDGCLLYILYFSIHVLPKLKYHLASGYLFNLALVAAR